MLATATLAIGTYIVLVQSTALYIIGAIVLIYTALGGLKAVIYTELFPWILLILGLVFIGLPIAYLEIGGLEGIRSSVAPEMLSLTNISWQDMVYWAVTIIPIWFVGMTL